MGIGDREVGGYRIEKELLPIDFYRFLADFDSITLHYFGLNKRFRHAGAIASNIRTLRYRGSQRDNNLTKNPYYGKSSRECFEMFYEHIQRPYKTNDELYLGLSITELKQIDDKRPTADNHTKFTTGGFKIKEWRICDVS